MVKSISCQNCCFISLSSLVISRLSLFKLDKFRRKGTNKKAFFYFYLILLLRFPTVFLSSRVDVCVCMYIGDSYFINIVHGLRLCLLNSRDSKPSSSFDFMYYQYLIVPVIGTNAYCRCYILSDFGLFI